MKQNGTELIKYGSKGQAWAPEFVAYMSKIVSHPAYADMLMRSKRMAKFNGKHHPIAKVVNINIHIISG